MTPPGPQRQPPLIDSLSVVIPVYDSAAILSSLTERLQAVLPSIAAQYEVIFVNDGSADASWESIVRLSGRHPWIRGAGLLRNYG